LQISTTECAPTPPSNWGGKEFFAKGSSFEVNQIALTCSNKFKVFVRQFESGYSAREHA